MDVKHIIVQAGGKGTRMEYLTYNKPKALIPVNNLPMLFHLFRKYPDGKYYIIGDYKYDVLEKYLAAFGEAAYKMIDARGKSGTCSGIREAVKYIPARQAVMLIWSDLILPDEFAIPEEEDSYVGIAKDFQCRWQYDSGIFREEASRTQGVAGYFIFKDRDEIADVPLEGEFVRWLQSRKKTFRELPLYKTKEYGILSEYQALPQQRCRPFNRIRVENDCVIKEGIDEQGRKLAVREIAWYQKIQEQSFHNIPLIYGTNPLKMEKINGKNIYEYQLAYEEKKDILKQLIECIRKIHALEGCRTDGNSYYEAYIGKTFERLKKVYDLVPFARDRVIRINGTDCPNVFFCREKIENQIKRYLPEKFCLLHGDCTFSNMMLREGKMPVLIDPRGYFGYTEFYGDPAYDWVKLYYSIVGNYDQFNLKRFRLKIEEREVLLKIESNHWEDMEDDFYQILGEEVTKEQMTLLHAIIWLSLTTYAWEDYDSICGAFYNGVLILSKVMTDSVGQGDVRSE